MLLCDPEDHLCFKIFALNKRERGIDEVCLVKYWWLSKLSGECMEVFIMKKKPWESENTIIQGLVYCQDLRKNW